MNINVKTKVIWCGPMTLVKLMVSWAGVHGPGRFAGGYVVAGKDGGFSIAYWPKTHEEKAPVVVTIFYDDPSVFHQSMRDHIDSIFGEGTTQQLIEQ